MIYLNIPSGLWPVPRGEELSIPVPPEFSLLVSDNEDEAHPDTRLEDAGSSYIHPTESDFKAPHLIKKSKLNNLIRDF